MGESAIAPHGRRLGKGGLRGGASRASAAAWLRGAPVAVPRVVLLILAVQTFAVAALATALLVRGDRVSVSPSGARTTAGTGASSPTGPGGARTASTPAGPLRVTVIRAIADGYVRATSATSSYGRTAELRVDGSPVARAYIRFEIFRRRAIRRATLRLYSLTSNESGVEVAPVSRNWSETSLSFATAPTPSASGVPSGPLLPQTWADIDVTALAHPDSEFTVTLIGLGPKELAFASRESGRFAPQLTVQFADAPAKAVTQPNRTGRSASGGRAAILIAAGDIASCASTGDEETARLVDRMRGTVALLGDDAYESGSAEEFTRCYRPSWGRQKARTRPAPGNHDYLTPGASGYFGYFGSAAGDPSKGYYSYKLGRWHVIALNSNCSIVPCNAGSPQERWLRSDLSSHRARCTLAYWHHPRFSSGQHGDLPATADFWRDLEAAGADVVLSGHDHDYERFVPVDADGRRDPAHGITEFVVGTGGKNHYRMTRPAPPTSAVRNDTTFGVLKLTLRANNYSWQFVPVAGATFTDTGSASCH
jgi:3',5'-cyclic AMP phosphodiesterase CpdA